MKLKALTLDNVYAQDAAVRYTAELVASNMVALLATLGYQALKIGLTHAGPVTSLARAGGTPIDGVDREHELPLPLRAVATSALRRCAETLAAVGVTSMDIDLTAEEITRLRELWGSGSPTSIYGLGAGESVQAPLSADPLAAPAIDPRVKVADVPVLPVIEFPAKVAP